MFSLVMTPKTVVLKIVDFFGLPITYASGLWLRNIRRGLHLLPLSRKALRVIGLMPVLHHYYEPLVFERDLRHSLTKHREISGLDLNVAEQLELTQKFHFNAELISIPLEQQRPRSFYYHNGMFESGDAEFLFNMVRHFKPSNILEVGGGYSTLMARHGIEKNTEEDGSYRCNHVCIEPYEAPWLEQIGVKVIRQKVELLDLDFFKALGKNDILFIDSSHVIRAQGDVLFEYLEVLGILESGVIIHAHDIFTPRDYPEKWVLQYSNFWNEQYLLEAFLSFNDKFRVLAALNYLWHNHREQLARACPILAQEPDREPASFWFVRN